MILHNLVIKKNPLQQTLRPKRTHKSVRPHRSFCSQPSPQSYSSISQPSQTYPSPQKVLTQYASNIHRPAVCICLNHDDNPRNYRCPSARRRPLKRDHLAESQERPCHPPAELCRSPYGVLSRPGSPAKGWLAWNSRGIGRLAVGSCTKRW